MANPIISGYPLMTFHASVERQSLVVRGFSMMTFPPFRLALWGFLPRIKNGRNSNRYIYMEFKSFQ